MKVESSQKGGMIMKDFDVKEYVASLSDEELCAEVLAWTLEEYDDLEEIEALIRDNKMSSIFVKPGISLEMIAYFREMVKKHSKSPCLLIADIESGPLFYPEFDDCRVSMMSLGAAGDSELAFEIGKYTARLSRALGISLTLGPVSDINLNPNNPVTNTRAAGDSADIVLTAAGSYARGIRSEGYMAVSVKHFPGDGADDRNAHFCTSVNNLSKEEWMQSYGKIYKTMIKEGAETVMPGHIALPWYDPTVDECGHMPASLSKPLLTDLLKGELGFDGCLVSDAMCMVGTAARLPVDKLSVAFLNAGGDLVLFPEKNDFKRVCDALKSGELPRQRLIDAAERVVELKRKLGLFEQREYEVCDSDLEKMRELLSIAAKKSITLIRNQDGVLPLNLKPGARVLVASLTVMPKAYDGDDYPAFARELSARGYEVISLTNPSHYKIDEIIDTVDAVFVCSYIDQATTRSNGGALRLGWNNFMTFWRGYIFRCKNVVFVSFGDPYKLYELPFLRSYVNAYASGESVVKAVVDCALGDAEFLGKSPVRLEGFFERG
jgi:beta-N-acetylhexosaminidase